MEYVADFLIGSQETSRCARILAIRAPSGCSKQYEGPMPIAVQWGGQVFRSGGNSAIDVRAGDVSQHGLQPAQS